MMCGPTQETPQILERVAYQYDVKVELPKVTHRPTVTIDSPAAGATIRSRFVQIKGSAGYPPPDAPQPGNVGHSWEGVTNWEVPQSEGGQAVPDPDTRTVLYFHGNAEEGCTGDGRTDLLACNGPFLMPKSQLSLSAAASWKTALQENIFLGGNDRTVFDPSWTWCLMRPGLGCPADPTYTPPGPRTVRGPMTVEWWAACVACDEQLGFAADWRIRIWADGVLKFERRVTAAPDTPNVAERVEATVNLPTIAANQRLTLHIDPVFIDAQSQTTQYYDSENPCQPGLTTGRCDSLVRMPVIAASEAAPDGPKNVRVTDLPADAPYPAAPQTPALRVAWDPLPGAASYEVYRSTDPAFAPSTRNRVHSGPGTACNSPQAPNPGDPPGHDRAGLCYTDTAVSLRTTYYYRVAAVLTNGTRTLSSLLSYGTPTRYDRQVKLKVDRLYGPQYWEYALLPPSPNPTLDDAGTQWTFLWDTVELFAGPHNVFARSHTQGIGSAKAFRPYVLEEDRDGDDGGGGGPGCPDDNDGDRDDDEEDGDSDDDGDDRDDDCEDDDDDEEEEDD
jgi:hypothetical protein